MSNARRGSRSSALRVVVVDDHPMWRRTLASVIEDGGVGKVVGEAADGAEAVDVVAATAPDVVIMDVNLPGFDGLEATRRILETGAECRILVLSASDQRADVLEAVRAGATGYLLKTTEPGEVVAAIRRVHDGEPVLPEAAARYVLDEVRSPTRTGDGIGVLVAFTSALDREGLAGVLEERGFDVLGLADRADALQRRLQEHAPQVVVLDGALPGAPDLGPAAVVRGYAPDAGVLVLASEADVAAAEALLAEGTERTGFLLRDRIGDVDQLVDAVLRVAAGGSVVDPEVAAALVRSRRAQDPVDALTPREREVLALMAEGRSNQAICERLFLSAKAVEAHVRNIFVKLGLEPAADDHRRVLAVIAYLRSAARAHATSAG